MNIDFSLPLNEPVLVFAIILFIILLSPIIFNKLKIPSIIGLIIAGVIIGPNGLNILARNSSIVLFGTVGLLYIMFLAGLEIDLNEFKKNKFKSLGFGIYTFVIPMLIGTTVFYFIFNYSLISSILIASMFASHTLVTYPIVSKLGISKNIAINTTIGGTMITDTAALIVLAIIVKKVTTGIDNSFWFKLIISIFVFAIIVIFIIPKISRWFFKKNSDSITQFIFVLGIVFLSSFLAMIAGIEEIIGAFFAGLALNRLIPSTSPLMNRIGFVGNALFIPFFLIGVGMLVDYKVLFIGFDAFIIAITMTIVAVVGKYFAAFLTQKTFRFSRDQRTIIFGLSNSQAAATLAAVLIGYNIIIGQNETGQNIRLLDDNILNGTIIMILITCTISSFATQKSALKIAKEELKNAKFQEISSNETTLVGLANHTSIDCLIHLAISTMSKKNTNELIGLHIITSENENNEKINIAKNIIENAQKFASSADFKLHPLIRYDNNIVSGIINTVKEKNVRHLFLGLHKKNSFIDTFYGDLTNDILNYSDCSIYIYKFFQPLNTLKKFILVIPENAHLESGFSEWFSRIIQISQNIGNKFEIFTNYQTIDFIQKNKKIDSNVSFKKLDYFEDFLIIAKDVLDDTMLLINLSRKNTISYQPMMEKIGIYLNKYFENKNCLLIFPNNFRK